MIRRTARSVMPTLAVMSRSLARGSWAMASRTRPWFVKNVHEGLVESVSSVLAAMAG